jgi:hypothetical protein
MILISHRGNLIGKDPSKENNPTYIQAALTAGYHCEIDLRMEQGQLYLGHDAHQYLITADFLLQRSDRLWVHCKDVNALAWALDNKLHCFWHQEDDYTLTSSQIIWIYPGKDVPNNIQSVVVMPERDMPLAEIKQIRAYGICSDIVELINGK